MKLFKITIFTFLFCFIALSMKTQAETKDTKEDNSDKKYSPIGGYAQLENLHLWRGLEITDEVNLVSDFYYHTRNDAFQVGFWGGAGITGKYKEFDYYASYKIKNFTLALWDIYNFSKDAKPRVFNYNEHSTSHILDISGTYQMPDYFPLKIYWATIFQGKDRSPLNDQNRYSTYVELSYPILRKNIVDLNVGVGGAFAFCNGRDADGKISDANLYGKHPGIVNINVTAAKTISIGKTYKLPISLTTWWNPDANYANLLFVVTPLTF